MSTPSTTTTTTSKYTSLTGPLTQTPRALHWVYKVGDLESTLSFYSNIFNLKVLRHEEFEKGCEATCNGPYAGWWSKTMIGTGPESMFFALELTYNYGVYEYRRGNDLRYIAIEVHGDGDDGVKEVERKAKEMGYRYFYEDDDGDDGKSNNANDKKKQHLMVASPDGYLYKVVPSSTSSTTTASASSSESKQDTAAAKHKDPFLYVSVNVVDLEKSVDYWHNILGMKKYAYTQGKSALLGFNDHACKLELVQLKQSPQQQQQQQQQPQLDHGEAFGRIAFSIPDIHEVYERVKASGDKIQNHPVKLDTPGKATVEVIILRDRNDYEICFVGEEGFNDLSTTKKGDDFIDFKAREERLQVQAKYDKRKKARAEQQQQQSSTSSSEASTASASTASASTASSNGAAESDKK